MASWGKLTFAQKQCVSLTGKLMQRTEMVAPHSRVGMAISGGVDSFAMLQIMLIRQAIMPFPIELMVLHVNPGFDPENHKVLARWCSERGVSAHLALTDHGPKAHSEENRKNSPCFYCSWRRRKTLFELCKKYELTHLAFGHNADDNVITYFMNIFQNGRASGIISSESFFDGKLQVIRPTLLLDKKKIRTAARQWELPVWENTCPSNGLTKRDDVRSWLEEIWKGDKRIKANVFNAISRQQVDLTRKKV
jgi:tRNA(Ile)-lysidine synthase TilS/MesJ